MLPVALLLPVALRGFIIGYLWARKFGDFYTDWLFAMRSYIKFDSFEFIIFFDIIILILDNFTKYHDW